jgi:hypothetical protein
MYTKEIILKGLNLGYPYFTDYSHPLATGNSGRVLLHRHIASVKLGRWLSSKEHVHHIDKDILNNTPDNLVVLSAEEHNNIHHPTIAKVCRECGEDFFSRGTKPIFCSLTCAGKYSSCTKIKNTSITKEELDAIIPDNTWVTLGKMFGYSDSGIKKRAKSLGCTIPIRRK